MCDPIAIMGVGVAAGAYGGYKSQDAQNQALEYQAKIQEQNANMAEMQATQTEQKGAFAEERLRAGIEGTKGAQRAGFGASGVTVGEGSALETVKNTAALGEVDAMTLRYNTALDAYGLRQQAKGYRSEAGMAREGKQSALLAGGLSLLSSGAGIGGSMLAAGPGKATTPAPVGGKNA